MAEIIKKIIKKIPGLKKIYRKFYSSELMFNYRYKRNKRMLQESPQKFVKFIYKKYTGRELNLDNPRTFNEKLQWLKLNHYDNLAVQCVDKYNVRQYVIDKGLGHLLNDLIHVYESPKEIDFTILPRQFVLKASHGSGMNIIVKDKNKISEKEIIKKLEKWMSINYSYMSGEWVYRDIKPRIVCERYIEDSNGELNDYKIFCFGGKAYYIQVDVGRFTNHRRNLYSSKWELLDLSIAQPNNDSLIIEKPKNLSKLIEFAEILAEPFIHARVDFYNLDDDIIFGEITFFHGGGFEKFTPEEYGIHFGDKIHIDKVRRREAWQNS